MLPTRVKHDSRKIYIKTLATRKLSLVSLNNSWGQKIKEGLKEYITQ
jgi:hypothetical protein